MIWNPNKRSGGEAVVAHLTAEITRNCGTTVDLDPSAVEEMARAIAHYLEEDMGCTEVDSEYLIQLASRALASLGHGPAARRLLVFGTGLVMPAEWEISGNDAMWILNLRQIAVRAEASLEMVFFGCLSIVMDSMADVWGECSGRGTLGLRHVWATAGSLLGERASRRKIESLADEIRAVCVEKLERMRQERGWASVPTVINLDIA